MSFIQFFMQMCYDRISSSWLKAEHEMLLLLWSSGSQAAGGMTDSPREPPRARVGFTEIPDNIGALKCQKNVGFFFQSLWATFSFPYEPRLLYQQLVPDSAKTVSPSRWGPHALWMSCFFPFSSVISVSHELSIIFLLLFLVCFFVFWLVFFARIRDHSRSLSVRMWNLPAPSARGSEILHSVQVCKLS